MNLAWDRLIWNPCLLQVPTPLKTLSVFTHGPIEAYTQHFRVSCSPGILQLLKAEIKPGCSPEQANYQALESHEVWPLAPTRRPVWETSRQVPSLRHKTVIWFL